MLCCFWNFFLLSSSLSLSISSRDRKKLVDIIMMRIRKCEEEVVKGGKDVKMMIRMILTFLSSEDQGVACSVFQNDNVVFLFLYVHLFRSFSSLCLLVCVSVREEQDGLRAMLLCGSNNKDIIYMYLFFNSVSSSIIFCYRNIPLFAHCVQTSLMTFEMLL